MVDMTNAIDTSRPVLKEVVRTLASDLPSENEGFGWREMVLSAGTTTTLGFVGLITIDGAVYRVFEDENRRFAQLALSAAQARVLSSVAADSGAFRMTAAQAKALAEATSAALSILGLGAARSSAPRCA